MIQCNQHWQLLREYTETRSEEAFSSFVGLYVDMVYSTALRQVRDKNLAEEVTQIVFIILARKARSIRPETVLSAWLHKTARYTALNLLRAQARRQAHERKAAEMISEIPRVDSSWHRLSPLLDEGVARLNEKDRAAITLRFMEQRSFADTATALGISEQAAIMRVQRAVEKLRRFFRGRRSDLPAGALSGILWANSTHIAPAGLAASIATKAMGAVAGSPALAAAVSAADAVVRAMAVAKAKAAAFMVGSFVAAVLAVGILVNYVVVPLMHRALTPPSHTASWEEFGLRDLRATQLESLMDRIDRRT